MDDDEIRQRAVALLTLAYSTGVDLSIDESVKGQMSILSDLGSYSIDVSLPQRYADTIVPVIKDQMEKSAEPLIGMIG